MRNARRDLIWHFGQVGTEQTSEGQIFQRLEKSRKVLLFIKRMDWSCYCIFDSECVKHLASNESKPLSQEICLFVVPALRILVHGVQWSVSISLGPFVVCA